MFAAGPTPALVTPPTSLFEYNPNTNTMSAVATPPALTANLTNNICSNMYMMNLPSGQILLSTATDQLWVYTPVGGPQNSWRPTISNVTTNGNGVYTLTGTQLNGLDEGSNFGDDFENATNYPIVQITDATGKVAYAQTFNWSSTGVATGNMPETTEFTLPSGLAPGILSVVVIANGIPSLPYTGNEKVFYPLRYIYDAQTGTYNGNLTVLTVNDPVFVTPSFKLVFPSLPQGATLVNPTGTIGGDPFLAFSEPLTTTTPIRIPIEISDPLAEPLSTFLIGFPVEIE